MDYNLKTQQTTLTHEYKKQNVFASPLNQDDGYVCLDFRFLIP